MRLERLIGERFKERPADSVIDSHAFMIRGGYIKHVANGIYSSYTVLRRITRKIEQIIREEMDAIDGQEVLFPVVLPASLWQESGRYDSVGSELARFNDRNGNPLLLGMTHEEAAVQLVREYGLSYTRYPFMIYQIQTKFRDEPRPRGGLIRVREFTMKDAYSFHTSQQDLDDYFARCYHAYETIFKRAGLPQVISVASDSGMMGGSVSYEFMLMTPIGEDTIVTCDNCEYRANMEAAESVITNEATAPVKPLDKVYTPNIKTIEDVCDYLHLPITSSCKAVVYQSNATDEYIIVFIRGDLEVNETKLSNVLSEDVHPAVVTDDSGLNVGYIGPYGIDDSLKSRILFDRSLEGIEDLCCGANEKGFHYTGLNIERDIGNVEYIDIAKAIAGGICPQCGTPSLKIARGVEVGHIFQLGAKYTKTMNMNYIDKDGKSSYPLMGCYGIGVGRLAAAVCEVSHDDNGPIWPLPIAPWQVHLCCIRADDAQTKEFADQLYKQLLAQGIEVIYDDRLVNAGIMFADADLLGVPIRVIVSPRNMKNGCCEVVSRDKSMSQTIQTDMIVATLTELLAASADPACG